MHFSVIGTQYFSSKHCLIFYLTGLVDICEELDISSNMNTVVAIIQINELFYIRKYYEGTVKL